MRKIFLTIGLLAGNYLFAQSLTQPNLPNATVTYPVTVKNDLISFSIQGNWDFSNVTTNGNASIVIEPIANSNVGNNYPNATHVKFEDGNQLFLGFNTNSFNFNGEISVITTSYQNPLEIIPYPFSVGDSHSDSELNVPFTCNGCPPSMYRDDSVYTEAISSGTLTMPDNTVHNDAILIHSKRYFYDGQTGSPTCNLLLDQWQWWVDWYAFPVAQSVELSASGACPPNVGYRQSKFLIGNPMELGESGMRPLNIYPNPTNDFFVVDGHQSEVPVGYVIQDLIGRTVCSGELTQDNKSVRVGSLPNGVYVFSLLNKTSEKLKFIKR